MLAVSSINISSIDVSIIILYLVGIVGLGCWAGFRQRRGTVGSGYFLAGRTLTWPMIGLALYSTNINTVHIVSLAQEGYKNGFAYGNYEWMAAFTLIPLALFFAPFYIRSRVATLPDFLEKRYDRSCRDWLAVLSLVSAIFIHIGFTIYAGAVVLKGMFGIPIMMSVITIGLLTGLYTTVGGLLAVVLTESIQAVLLMLGAICVTSVGLYYAGGWSAIIENTEPVKMALLRPTGDPSNLPWYAVILGYPVIGLWYWCADQTIVQRVLGAKDENHARVGALFTGFIKIIDVFVFVFPGLICFVLIKQGKLSGLTNSEDAYAFMVDRLLPVGLRGLIAASLLAALMGAVAGALNSIATLFSYDIYKRWRPQTPDKTLVFVGRVATVCSMIAAILWSPFLSRYPSIYQGIVALISCIAPPVTAVFLFGVFWKKASSKAAFTTLWMGSIAGFVVFLIVWFKTSDWLKQYIDWNVPMLLVGFYLFVLCSVIMFIVSVLHPHKHTADSEKLVWNSPIEALRGDAWKGIGNYKILSVVLFFTVIALYWIFQWQPWR